MHTHPKLFLMLGYPGAGKTTASKVIHELTGAVHLWADHERRSRFESPTYSHTENLALYDSLNDKTRILLKAGTSVIYDTTFNYYTDRERLRNIADDAGARVVLVWVKTNKSVAKIRATKDAHNHVTRILGNMPEEHFERMCANLEKPRNDEPYIELDGTKLSKEYVAESLGL